MKKKNKADIVSNILYWGGFLLTLIGVWQVGEEVGKQSFEAGKTAGYFEGRYEREKYDSIK